MKPGLKRIENTLDQLKGAQVDRFVNELVKEPIVVHPATPSLPSLPNLPLREPPAPPLAASANSSAAPPPRSPQRPAQPSGLSPFAALPQPPALPKNKPATISHHRHAVNPNLAIGMVREVENTVLRWQLEIEQVVLQIQALYQEGPIVDGWLESQSHDSPNVQPVGSTVLRHAEIEHLMEFVEEICGTKQYGPEAARAGYRLCGLDADGQLWWRACPPQQVPYVGLAIARYQKLRLLLSQKQAVEAKLQNLVQALAMLQSQLQG